MKKEYIRPTIEVENFVANEYVATCVSIYKCNAETQDNDYNYIFLNSTDAICDTLNNKDEYKSNQYVRIKEAITNETNYYSDDNGNYIYLVKCTSKGCLSTSTLASASFISSISSGNTVLSTSAFSWRSETPSEITQNGTTYSVYVLHAATEASTNGS